MASVSSLDQDMRNLRLSRYTPQAASEIRTWIEQTLNSPLPAGDVLEALKDGVALCKLANLLLPSPGIKYKTSSMPFIQMENISHFLKACEMPPLSMPAHDRFLTVDLYESKDPAQVVQCLGAFSRKAQAVRPDVFTTVIGAKKTSVGGTMSPSNTGAGATTNGSAPSWKQPSFGRSPSPTKPPTNSTSGAAARALSPSLTGGSTGSQGGSKSGPVSSWSNRSDEGITSPAWNIHQYGYMGGASQGNQGISFGARRQITSQGPSVPSLAEKEKRRKEREALEAERSRQEQEELDQRRREREAEEERAREEEERRLEDRTRRTREEERRRVEEQKLQWADQERRWKEEEEARRHENEALKKKLPPERPRVPSSGILRGQTLSQYHKAQADLAKRGAGDTGEIETPEQKRVRELEKQLEEARERERVYQAEREERMRRGKDSGSRPSTAQTERETAQSEASWTGGGDEREVLRREWQKSNDQNVPEPKTAASTQAGAQQQRSLSSAQPPAAREEPLSSRPLPPPRPESPKVALVEEQEAEEGAPPPALPQRAQPSASASSLNSLKAADSAPTSSPLGTPNRPLPTPNKEYQSYIPPTKPAATATPPTQPPRISSTLETGTTSLEQSRDRDARLASQTSTKAGGVGAKSLLEREMERERERQREWERNQEEVKSAPRDPNQGTGEGQSWDVNQYGFVGGDSQNRGSGTGSGIAFGGRRQILGPREMKR